MRPSYRLRFLIHLIIAATEEVTYQVTSSEIIGINNTATT